MAWSHGAESISRRRSTAPFALVLACSCYTASSLPGNGGPYVMEQQFVDDDFFDKWNFYTGGDPTHGTVEFVDYGTAVDKNILSASADRVFIGADTTEVLSEGQGRKAIKLVSKCQYNSGLFVLKVDHVPSACGSWPAFWMFGEDSQHAWPRWGEYDILESVHNLTYSATTLHTGANCDQRLINTGLDFSGQGWSTGTQGNPTKNCFVAAANQYSNEGCGQKMPYGSFGPPLNSGGGGTWAADWDPEQHHIRTWFFPAGQEPLDLLQKAPRPEYWGVPTSFFTLDPNYCSARHFKNMRMVFDTTFCGDYGAATFNSACPLAGMSCEDFVRKRPREFTEAYWSVKGLDVYQRENYAKYTCDADLNTGHPAGKSTASNMGWLLAGILLTGMGVMTTMAVRHWPNQAQKKSRGLAAETGHPAGDALAQCLDVNIEQLQQGELVVSHNLPQLPHGERTSTRSQVPYGHAGPVQPRSPQGGRNGATGFTPWAPMSYFQASAPGQQQQPYAIRSNSSNSQPPPTPTRGNQVPQSGFFNWANPQPTASRSTSPPSYIPSPVTSGQGFQRSSGGGTWGSFIMNGVQQVVPGGLGGAYSGGRSQTASPVGSMNSGSYTLPPTINALGSGHIPQNYQPVPSRY